MHVLNLVIAGLHNLTSFFAVYLYHKNLSSVIVASQTFFVISMLYLLTVKLRKYDIYFYYIRLLVLKMIDEALPHLPPLTTHHCCIHMPDCQYVCLSAYLGLVLVLTFLHVLYSHGLILGPYVPQSAS